MATFYASPMTKVHFDCAGRTPAVGKNPRSSAQAHQGIRARKPMRAHVQAHLASTRDEVSNPHGHTSWGLDVA